VQLDLLLARKHRKKRIPPKGGTLKLEPGSLSYMVSILHKGAKNIYPQNSAVMGKGGGGIDLIFSY
jgi:hypothetical protein